jgi:hypothetical protein
LGFARRRLSPDWVRDKLWRGLAEAVRRRGSWELS